MTKYLIELTEEEAKEMKELSKDVLRIMNRIKALLKLSIRKRR